MKKHSQVTHEFSIAQWLERLTGIWKVMGSTPVGGSENSFSEYFDLRTLFHYLHFIQVTNPFIISKLIFSFYDSYMVPVLLILIIKIIQ